MKINVTLDNEQINEIANITADKVLQTVQYQKNNEEWYDREIKQLKIEVSKRDSMLVQKDLYADRLKETIKKLRDKLSENNFNK
jgi:sensor histidine kinase YesM